LIQVAQIPSVVLPILAGKYNWKDASRYLWEATKLFSAWVTSREVLVGFGKVSDTHGDIFTKSIGNLPKAKLEQLGLLELMTEAESRGVLRTSVISEVNRALYTPNRVQHHFGRAHRQESRPCYEWYVPSL